MVGSNCIRRSAKRAQPKRLAGWYGNQLWLWRGTPQKLTVVREK